MNIQVRPARQPDLPWLQKLYAAFDREANPPLSPEPAQAILSSIGTHGTLFVAEAAAERVVGCCSVYLCDTLVRGGRPFAVIEHVVVAPDLRRLGIGRQLVSAAVRTADLRGCYKVMLMTGSNRVANHRFYEACGFAGDKIGFQRRANASLETPSK